VKFLVKLQVEINWVMLFSPILFSDRKSM
jgi:hypothetical protein